jgi:sugar O-acyltransferase (sialic acid O-acetyltransferase NeuD family)
MRSETNAVAILGFHDGAAGQVETWLEKATGLKIACFIIDSDSYSEVDIDQENRRRTCKTTDFPQNGMFKGHPLIVADNWIEILMRMGVSNVISLEPSNSRRRFQIDVIKRSGLNLVSAIHPSALILPHARIDAGVWVNAGCIIGYKAEISSGVIVNTGVQIDHHNVLLDCCQVDPGVVIAGNAVLEECCHIHTGATIINRVKIGKNSIIGAGAVVLQDIPPDCTAVGVPARVIKSVNS